MQKSLFYFSIATILVGCNSEESSKENKPETVPPIISNAMLVQLEGSGTHSIDVGNFINSIDKNSRISSVKSIDYDSSACTLLDYSSNEIQVQANSLGHCEYKITVERSINNQSNKTDSTLLVNIGKDINNNIKTISELAIKNNEININFASKEETRGFIEQGYTLDSTNISLFGDAELSSDGNSITVTTSDNLGLNRIFYFLIKAEGGEVVDSKPGVIDITVTSETNLGPHIENKDFAQEGHTNTFYNFDLRRDSVVSDADNLDELQIIELESPLGGSLRLGTSEAPLEPTDPAAQNNTAFHFAVDSIGNYPITYTVSDHRGGYATGYVRFEAGLLTNPNSPSAVTPGRMVESIEVTDAIDKQYLSRPKLLAELPTAYQGDSTVSANETWALMTQEEASNYCQSLDLHLPTSEAYQALIVGNASITSYLGWPTIVDADKSTIPYLVRKTNKAQTTSHPTLNPVTGEFSTTNKGLVTCVPYNDKAIVVSEADITVTDLEPVKNLTVGNANLRYLDISCSSNNAAVSATCTNESLQVTGHSPINSAAVITVNSNGESLTGNETSSSINVISRVDAALPRITDFAIDAMIDTNGDGVLEQTQIKRFNVADSEFLRLVRPPTEGNIGSELSSRWTFRQNGSSDQDNQGESRPSWASQNNGQVVSNTDTLVSSQHTGNGYGVEARIQPVSIFGEVGAIAKLDFQYQQNNPVINNLSMYANQSSRRGFTNIDTLVGTFDYTDANNDAKKSENLIWEVKQQWEPESSYSQITDLNINRFHGGNLRGRDLRLKAQATDVYNSRSNEIVGYAYPIASAENQEVVYRSLASSDPLSFKHLGSVNPNGQTLSGLNDWCQDNYTPESTFGTGGLLPTLPELQTLLNDSNRPRYYHSNYANLHYVPYKNSSNGLSWLDLNTKGANVTPVTARSGLICVNKQTKPSTLTFTARYNNNDTVYNVSVQNEDSVYQIEQVSFEVAQTSLSNASTRNHTVSINLRGAQSGSATLGDHVKINKYDVLKNTVTAINITDKFGRSTRINAPNLNVYSKVPVAQLNSTYAYGGAVNGANQRVQLDAATGVLRSFPDNKLRLHQGGFQCAFELPGGGGALTNRITWTYEPDMTDGFDFDRLRFKAENYRYTSSQLYVYPGRHCIQSVNIAIEGVTTGFKEFTIGWDILKSSDRNNIVHYVDVGLRPTLTQVIRF
ncbi:adhesion domain-containing protein [Vibrio harveyi]|nr:DUF823 domain-containing adhesin [Vibrio harveyi]PNM42795.1 hypothetical protein AL469_023030 [Vibrio harveyi]